MAGISYTTDTLLLAGILDQLRFQSWAKTKGARSGKNKPKSILNSLMERRQEKEDEIMKFGSGAEYDAYRAKLLRR